MVHLEFPGRVGLILSVMALMLTGPMAALSQTDDIDPNTFDWTPVTDTVSFYLVDSNNSGYWCTKKYVAASTNLISSHCKTGADQLLYRTHKKILVIDGRQAVTGGMNYGFLYLGDDQWRDTNVLLTGPVVASLQTEFMRDWESLGDPVADPDRYFPALAPTGSLAVRVIDQRPAVNDIDVNAFVVIALRSAQHHVDISAPYLNPTDWLADELLRTAARGVRVRILTNSAETVDIPSAFSVTASCLRPLIDGGVEIYLWGQNGHTMHSKAMVVDDKLAMLGSYNFNQRSIVWDTESIAVFTDLQAVAEVQTMLDRDLDPNRVIPVDEAWFSAQSPEDLDLWNTAGDFGIFF